MTNLNPERHTQSIFHKLNIEYDGNDMMPLFRSVDEGVHFAQIVKSQVYRNPAQTRLKP